MGYFRNHLTTCVKMNGKSLPLSQQENLPILLPPPFKSALHFPHQLKLPSSQPHLKPPPIYSPPLPFSLISHNHSNHRCPYITTARQRRRSTTRRSRSSGTRPIRSSGKRTIRRCPPWSTTTTAASNRHTSIRSQRRSGLDGSSTSRIDTECDPAEETFGEGRAQERIFDDGVAEGGFLDQWEEGVSWGVMN